MNTLQGDFPNQDSFVSLASCDSKYLYAHAPAFLASSVLSHNDVHLHIINPSEDDLNYAHSLRALARKLSSTPPHISISWEEYDLNSMWARMDEEEKRTYYACNRFIVAPQILAKAKSLFITDIDCLFMHHVFEPGTDIALFLREALPGTVGWEARGTRVAAGAVFYNKSALPFAIKVRDKILTGELKWFLDQVAISETYEEEKNNYTFHQYTPTFLDWEFEEDTFIWTGKGPRKYDNPKYLARKAFFEGLLK